MQIGHSDYKLYSMTIKLPDSTHMFDGEVAYSVVPELSHIVQCDLNVTIRDGTYCWRGPVL